MTILAYSWSYNTGSLDDPVTTLYLAHIFFSTMFAIAYHVSCSVFSVISKQHFGYQSIQIYVCNTTRCMFIAQDFFWYFKRICIEMNQSEREIIHLFSREKSTKNCWENTHRSINLLIMFNYYSNYVSFVKIHVPNLNWVVRQQFFVVFSQYMYSKLYAQVNMLYHWRLFANLCSSMWVLSV